MHARRCLSSFHLFPVVLLMTSAFEWLFGMGSDHKPFSHCKMLWSSASLLSCPHIISHVTEGGLFYHGKKKIHRLHMGFLLWNVIPCNYERGCILASYSCSWSVFTLSQQPRLSRLVGNSQCCTRKVRWPVGRWQPLTLPEVETEILQEKLEPTIFMDVAKLKLQYNFSHC